MNIFIEFYQNIFIEINDFITNSKILFPLIRSLISAYIFWIVFSYLPTQKKKKKLRPIIEYDIYSIGNGLSSIFDIIFRYQHTSPSYYQNQILSGKLNEKDFYIALQNKCLNKTYLYPTEVSLDYLVIGESLVEKFEDLEELINKIMNMNEYAKPDELILLEQIRKKLKTYSLNYKTVNNSAVTIINGQPHSAVVSNLGYMRKNMYELYMLYQDIQKIIFLHSKYINRNIVLNHVQYLFHHDKFKQCKKMIKKYKGKYENTTSLLEFYELLCDYRLKKINYKKVDIVLKKRYYNGSLVSSRSFIKELKNDPKILEVIEKYYSQEEITYCFETIEKEKVQKRFMLERNQQIASFFEEKDSRLKNINI